MLKSYIKHLNIVVFKTYMSILSRFVHYLKMRKAADGANKSLLYIVYPVELNVRASEHKVALIAFLKVILA